MSTDDEIAENEFRKRVHPRDGEWDFAGFFTREPERARPAGMVIAESIKTIVDGTHSELRLNHMRDLVSSFVSQHGDTLREFADMLTCRRNTEKGYLDSPIAGRDRYQLYMDKYIDVLRSAACDFKKIGDTTSPAGGMEILRKWTQDTVLIKRLDEALRRAGDATPKNELRVFEAPLAEKVDAAYKDVSSLVMGMERIAQQPTRSQIL